MSQLLHNTEGDIDWETVFKRMTGSQESAISRENLGRYLSNTRDVTLDDAAIAVSKASDDGELLKVVVERYPYVDRKFYFVPRVRFEHADSVYIPFWSYLSEEVDFDSGEGVDTDALLDRIVKRSDRDISDRTLSAIDDHLEELVPVYTPQQSHRGRTLETGEATLYGDLAMSEY